MQASEFSRAVAAARAIATSVGLPADEVVVLQDSNRLTVRLLPGDVLAQVAPATAQVAQLEIELAQRLTVAGSPVAALDPRVPPLAYDTDGFVVTLWTYYAPVAPGVAPADYAAALARLHAGLRDVDVPAPHYTDRVGQAQRLVASRDRSPALTGADREFLGDTLDRLRQAVGRRAAAEQLLHGEPHPGNVLATSSGPRFVDLETCCRGPVEFDVAFAPDEVAEHYPAADPALLRDCRILALAVNTAWRWDRADQLPDGQRLGIEWLSLLRTR
jgi:aminoglycoside phosphotransferase (APT) family kinase protein